MYPVLFYWTVFPPVSNSNKAISCSGLAYLGGPTVSFSLGYFERTYTDLISHDLVYINIPAYMVGAWQSTDTVSLEAEGRLLAVWGTNNYTVSGSCGSLSASSLGAKVIHSGSTFTFRVNFNIVSNLASKPFFIIKDVYLTFRNNTGNEAEVAAVWNSGSTPQVQSPASAITTTTCNWPCQRCFGSGAEPCAFCNYVASNNGDGGGCRTCGASCGMCAGTNLGTCIMCLEGYTLRTDHTCVSSGSTACDTGQLTKTAGNFKICVDPCPTGQYMRWNYTCAASCDSPLTLNVANSISCQFPCNYLTFEYLFWNGSCLSTCPYYQRNENQYLFCDACAPGLFYYQNSSCLPSCEQYFNPTQQGGSNFCTYPCASESYLSWNGSCLTTCNASFVSEVASIGKFCNQPCTNTTYYYYQAEQQCQSTCQYPYQASLSDSSVKLCLFKCTNGTFLYQNGTCLLTCQQYFVPVVQGEAKYCNYPCGSQSYLNWNGSCITNCDASFTSHMPSIGNFCNYLCENITYYYFQAQNMCQSTCNSPNITTISKNSVKLCTIYVSRPITINALTTTMIATSVMDSNAFGFFFLTSFTKMFDYIEYLQITYPVEIQEILDDLSTISSTFNFLPDIPSGIVAKLVDHPLPEKFEDNGLSSSFLVNFWGSLMALIFYVGVTLLLSILERYTRKLAKVHKVIKEIVLIFRWNYCILVFLSSYGDAILFACLECITLDLSTPLALLSFIICVIILLIGIILILACLRIIRRIWKAKKGSKDIHKVEKRKLQIYRAFFEDYKDQFICQQLFVMIYTIRIVLFFVIIGAGYRYPLFQASGMIILNCLMLLYLIFVQPFISKVELFQQITYEILLLIINICVLILACMESIGATNPELKSGIGKLIKIINIIGSLACIVFIVLIFILYIKKIYLKYRRRRRTAAVNNTSITDNNSMSPLRQLQVNTSIQNELGCSKLGTSMVEKNTSTLKILEDISHEVPMTENVNITIMEASDSARKEFL